MLFEIIGKTSSAVGGLDIASPQDLVVRGQVVDSFSLCEVQWVNNIYITNLGGSHIRLDCRSAREKEGRRKSMVVADFAPIMIDM